MLTVNPPALHSQTHDTDTWTKIRYGKSLLSFPQIHPLRKYINYQYRLHCSVWLLFICPLQSSGSGLAG